MGLSWPVEEQGSTGENVRSIQYLINAWMPAPAAAATAAGPLAVDGVFGPQTDAAVRDCQAAHGLAVDGKVGSQTWPVLIVEVSAGSTGAPVEAVQSQLHGRSGWLEADGTFGQQTDRVVRSFQQFCQLSVDGIVGPSTWNALTLQWLRVSSGESAAELVFQGWSSNDRAAARYEAIPAAVDMLFARTYEAGWTFGGCQTSGGRFTCTWQRTGDKLIFEGNNSTGLPFYYVHNVTSEI